MSLAPAPPGGNSHRGRLATSWDEAKQLLACEPFRRGYIEVQTNTAPDFDRYREPLDGFRYENGRQFATELRRRLTNGRLPQWPVLRRPPQAVQCLAMDLIRERWSEAA